MTGANSVRVEVGRESLRLLLLAALREKAKAQGVAIEDLELELHPLGPRTVRADAKVTAKMMMRAVLDVTAELEIDDDLQATVKELGVDIGGGLAAMLGGLIEQQTAKVRGKKIALAALPVQGVEVRDVRVDVSDGLVLEADLAG